VTTVTFEENAARRWSPYTNSTPHGGPRRSPRRFGGRPAEQFAQLEELLAGRSDHTAATGVWKDNDDIHEQTRIPKDFTATAVLTAIPPVQAKETPTMSKENFADVNGQHIFYSAHGRRQAAHSSSRGHQPRQLRSNLAELPKVRQVIASIFRRMGARQTRQALRCETMGTTLRSDRPSETRKPT